MTAEPLQVAPSTVPTRARAQVVVDAVRDPRWARLVDARGTSVFQSQPWLRVIAETYAFPLRARLLLDGAGEPVAGVVYAEVSGLAAAPRLVGLPFSDFCDPIVRHGGDWAALADGLLSEGRRVDLRCLYATAPLGDPRFAVAGRDRWHAIDLDRDEEEIWGSLHGSARRAIRKARADGVTVKVARDRADLRAFYELHLRVRKRKYGLLAQPYAFFESIWERFLAPGQGVLILGLLEGRPASGCLFLEWGDTLSYKFNASDGAYLASRPNDRVLWEGILHARRQGLATLDFGLTDWDQEGLVRYKRKYATDEKTITSLRHDPTAGPSPGERQVRALLRDVTALLADESVPDGVSERAGDLLYRHFA